MNTESRKIEEINPEANQIYCLVPVNCFITALYLPHSVQVTQVNHSYAE